MPHNSSLLALIIPCLSRRKQSRTSVRSTKSYHSFTPSFPPVLAPPLTPNEHLLVDRLVNTLITHCTNRFDPSLEASIALTIHRSDTVNPTDWSWPITKATIAENILNAISFTIQHSERFEIGGSIWDALVKVREEAEKIPELAKGLEEEHPVLVWAVCVALALGTLYVLWPGLIAALGFGELGPVEGSFAAAWQSLYGGEVPIGSLFSLLQRLGMTLKGGVAVRDEGEQDEKLGWMELESPSEVKDWKVEGVVCDEEELEPLVRYD